MTVLTTLALGVLIGPAVVYFATRAAGSATVSWVRILVVTGWIVACFFMLISKAHGLAEPAVWFWAVSFGVGLAVIDVDVHRLPMSWLVPMLVGGVALLAGEIADHAQWAELGRATAASLVAFAGVLAIQLVSGVGLGYGDTKLCAVIGFYCGTVGWSAVLTALITGFVLNGLIAVCLVKVYGLRGSSRFAAGPGLLAGALVAVMLA